MRIPLVCVTLTGAIWLALGFPWWFVFGFWATNAVALLAVEIWFRGVVSLIPRRFHNKAYMVFSWVELRLEIYLGVTADNRVRRRLFAWRQKLWV